MKKASPLLAAGVTMMAFLAVSPDGAEGQGRGSGARAAEASVAIDLSVDARTSIREYYSAHPVANAEGLPPGIRRNLARGKPLPPGIAKKSAPAELQSSLRIADGYEIVEVGLDVFLVEVATNMIHEVLMDVIRGPY